MRIVPSVRMLGALGACAKRARTINDLGVAYVGLSIRDVGNESTTEGGDDPIMVAVAQGVLMIVVIQRCPFSLAFCENDG